MASESYVLERMTQMLIEHGVISDATGLASRLLQAIHAGDDIGNGLRAIPIEALEELRSFMERGA